METLSHYAYRALDQHFHKVIKHEKGVLQQQEPEAIHQMRVGLRRLRTALQVFEPALELPKGTGIKQIRAIATCLGQVRDLDVLHETLTTAHSPHLPEIEQKRLDQLLKKLHQLRQRKIERVRRKLSSATYCRFKQGFQHWLAHPAYTDLSHWPIQAVVSDLLLPLISQLLIHPAWLVGVTWSSADEFDQEKLGQDCSSGGSNGLIEATCLGNHQEPDPEELQRQGSVLHELRKQTKRVRYQMELFTDFFGEDYQQQVKEFATLQELLGQLQDGVVLQHFLHRLGADLDRDLPSLGKRLQSQQALNWQKWQYFQERYLDHQFRHGLRQLVA